MQTTLFSMITFLTTVLMVSSAWAADDKGCSPTSALAACKEMNSSDIEKCVKNLLQTCSGAGGADAFKEPCELAAKDVAEPSKEFAKACSAFNLGVGTTCEEKVLNCKSGFSEYGEDDEDSKVKSKDDVDADKYKECPIPALQDAKDAKEKIKKLEDEIESLDDKIDTAQEKVQTAQGNIDTKEAERLKKNNELKAAYEAELKEKGLADEKKLKDAQEAVDKVEKAILELEQAKNDQDVQYAVDLAKIEGICEEIAEKALAAQIDNAVKAVQAGQLKKKDLNAQLALASSGRTKQNEDFRKREIARCRADDAKWKKPIELLNLNYQNNRFKIETAIKEMYTKRTKTYTELSSGIPTAQQKEATQLSNKYQSDLAATKAEFDKEIGECGGFNPTLANGKPNQTTMPNGCTGLNKQLAEAVAKKANLESEREDKKSNLEYYTELLRVASAKIKDVDATDVPDLLSAAKSYADAIDAYASKCQDNPTYSSKVEKYRKSLSDMGEEITTILKDPPTDVRGTDGIVESTKPTSTKTVPPKPAGPPAKSGK